MAAFINALCFLALILLVKSQAPVDITVKPSEDPAPEPRVDPANPTPRSSLDSLKGKPKIYVIEVEAKLAANDAKTIRKEIKNVIVKNPNAEGQHKKIQKKLKELFPKTRVVLQRNPKSGKKCRISKGAKPKEGYISLVSFDDNKLPMKVDNWRVCLKNKKREGKEAV